MIVSRRKHTDPRDEVTRARTEAITRARVLMARDGITVAELAERTGIAARRISNFLAQNDRSARIAAALNQALGSDIFTIDR